MAPEGGVGSCSGGLYPQSMRRSDDPGCGNNWANGALLNEYSTPLAFGIHNSRCLQLDPCWFVRPHADRRKLSDHVDVGHFLPVVFAASDLHLHTRLHDRSEEHTSELQSRDNLVCRLLLEK